MLILTEGPSEVEYFNMFRGRNRHVTVVPLVAKKHDPRNLVPYCSSKAYERGIDLENGDSVSVVIDVDDRTDSELMDIERQCRERGYELYLSKRSFECWLILHFRKLTKAMTQEELESELSECIGHRYRKSEGICKMITEESVRSAIERAGKIISDDEGCNNKCMHQDPSTAVHFLVKRILEVS